MVLGELQNPWKCKTVKGKLLFLNLFLKLRVMSSASSEVIWLLHIFRELESPSLVLLRPMLAIPVLSRLPAIWFSTNEPSILRLIDISFDNMFCLAAYIFHMDPLKTSSQISSAKIGPQTLHDFLVTKLMFSQTLH